MSRREMRKTKQDRRARGSKREEILDHALALFIEHGMHQVSTRRIAEAVGISQPSLYAHFPTRDAIAVELCCRAFDDLHDRLEATSRAEADPRARIHRLGRTYIDFGLRHEAAYRVAFMLELPAEHTAEKTRVVDAGVRAFGVLRRAFDDLAPGADAAELAAQCAWASMHGLVSLLLARPDFPFIDREMLIEAQLARCTNQTGL
jgi:AcrR family transcriptional regulator